MKLFVINTLWQQARTAYAVWRSCLIAALTLCFGVVPALATEYSCTFGTECYEDEACSDTAFKVAVRDQDIVTDFGTFPVLALREQPGRLTAFVQSEGAVYLLSASDKTARFTAHISDGPQSITYLGQCEVQS